MNAKEINTELSNNVMSKEQLHQMVESLYGVMFSVSTISTGNVILQMAISQIHNETETCETTQGENGA